MDLDVEYERGKCRVGFRVVVLPGHEKSMTRLCTNLPRTPFSLDLVSQLYQLRWQIEHIAAGLIWASLCAAVLKRFLAHAAQLIGGKPISTRRVAMCAGHIIDEIVTALLAYVRIASAFRDGMAFLQRLQRNGSERFPPPAAIAVLCVPARS